jgi:hypothetical protein
MSDEHSVSPPPSRPRADILHEVAVAIRQHQARPEGEADLAAAAHLLCEDTRNRSLPIERAIIDLKSALLSETPELTPGDAASVTRARVIRMTIEEYYRP